MGCDLRAASHQLHVRIFDPDRNGERVFGELSRGNELPNVFLEKGPMSRAPPQKCFSGWATPQRALAGWLRYLGQIPWISRDSS